jgi:hypothetical protein
MKVRTAQHWLLPKKYSKLGMEWKIKMKTAHKKKRREDQTGFRTEMGPHRSFAPNFGFDW